MSEVTTEPGALDTGQAAGGPDGDQTTATAPAAGEGQSADGTTATGPQVDTFFDPKTVPDELQPAYKQMQAAFTKRMQGLSSDREKVEAYNAFMADPVAQLQTMAKQYGFDITRQGQQQEPAQDPNAQPETWDQVYKTAEQRAYDRIMGEIRPVLDQIQTMKATAIENQLDELDPMWRNYEEAMKIELQQNPNLALDPAKLYKLVVPDSVIQDRATQAALKKLEAKTQAAGVSGGSTTTRQPAGNIEGSGPRSFAESVEAAKKQLASQGIAPPGR